LQQCENLGRRSDEFAFIEVHEAKGCRDPCAQSAIRCKYIMLKPEATAVQRQPGNQHGNNDLLHPPDFPPILNFIFHPHNAESKASEFLSGNPISAKIDTLASIALFK